MTCCHTARSMGRGGDSWMPTIMKTRTVNTTESRAVPMATPTARFW